MESMAVKFKFKTQEYQTKAVNSVVEVFKGQGYHDGNPYQIERDYSAQYQHTPKALLSANAFTKLFDTGYSNYPLQLSDKQLLLNIHTIQDHSNITRSANLSTELGRCSLDIEMETGTGKTYVYIKTMFELNQQYGWSKFIIVVPSIAIREGVKKSLDITCEHFMDHYHKRIRSFIYNSSNLNEINDFAQSPDLFVMIINSQAFNNISSCNKNTESRIIYSERDAFGSRRPIDILSGTNPILILDEPQKLSGKATAEAMKNFNPLLCLNYSATHKNQHNCVYALDALDAYNHKLVKRIEVVGIEAKNLQGTNGYLYLENILTDLNKPPRAVLNIEQRTKSAIQRKTIKLEKGDDLYYKSGNLREYSGYIISDINAVNGTVEFSNGVIIQIDEVRGNISAHDMIRIQLRQTIKTHLLKEQKLFKHGIKVLSLFFLDTVKHYRDYDAPDQAGVFQKLFEQEYQAVKQELFANGALLDEDKAYLQYLNSIETKATHAGYFSIDKKNKRMTDPKLKGSAKEGKVSDSVDDYDLILKDKERLLSLNNPVRFIFSHSALREGWDNPNIFQICSLRQAKSIIQKRQEVGRGLRICVDQQGNRQDSELLGEEFHDFNLLTIIAPESYASFAQDLQSEISQALHPRPQKVDMEFLTGKTIEIYEAIKDSESKNEPALKKTKHTITDAEAFDIIHVLRNLKAINAKGEINAEFADKLNNSKESANFNLGVEEEYQHLSQYSEGVFKLLEEVQNPQSISSMVKRRSGVVTPTTKLTELFNHDAFQYLWEQINHKYIFHVDFDSNTLIENSIRAIRDNLLISKRLFHVTSSKLKQELTQGTLEQGSAFENATTKTEVQQHSIKSLVRYDLLGQIAAQADLTRETIAKILTRLPQETFAQYKYNPEEFISQCVEIINGQKGSLAASNIKYTQTPYKFDNDIFEQSYTNKNSKYVLENAQKSVTLPTLVDSDIEKQFSEDMDCEENIEIYAKLPSKFVIPTPVGNYNPDWALVLKKNYTRHVYLIAETKGTKNEDLLRPIEKSKIQCARKLFEGLDSSEVKYSLVVSLDDVFAYRQQDIFKEDKH